MVYHAWLQRIDYNSSEQSPEEIRRGLDFELGVGQWTTPLSLRQQTAEPRVTEDGLTVPAWWTDDETESQQMLAAMGME